MLAFWRKIQQGVRKNLRPAEERIVVEGTVITVLEGGQCISRIAVADIDKIEAYKIDEFTTDLICFDIHTVRNGEPVVNTLHEELTGFTELTELLKKLPGFETDWYGKVAQPPFDEKRTVIFER